MKTTALAMMLLPAICGVPALRGQGWEADNLNQAGEDSLFSRPKRGIQIYNVSTGAAYYSQALPADPSYVARNQLSLGSDISTVSSVTIGYWLPGRASDFTILYSPTYTSSANYSDWNRLNHFLTLRSRAGKPVKRIGRLALDLNFRAEVNNFENFLFTPMLLSQAANAPATFEDLAGAMTHGSYTNDQLASILTGAPVVESPARLLFYGDRVLTASANMSATYSVSPRLTTTVAFGASRFQPVQNGSPSDTSGAHIVQLHTTTGGMSTTTSYAWTPNTHISFSAEAHRSLSQVMDAYIETGSVALSRVFHRHWYLEAKAGAGSVQPVGKSAVVPTGLQYLAGASVGYKMRTHTFLASIDRTLSDSYALGAGSSITYTGAWNWHRPASKWRLDAAYVRQNLDGLQAGTFSSWLAQAGIKRELTRQLMAAAQYSRASYGGAFNQQIYNIGLDGARLTLIWTPSAIVPARTPDTGSRSR